MNGNDVAQLNVKTSGTSEAAAGILSIKQAIFDTKQANEELRNSKNKTTAAIATERAELQKYEREMTSCNTTIAKAVTQNSQLSVKLAELEANGKSGSKTWQTLTDKVNQNNQKIAESKARQTELNTSMDASKAKIEQLKAVKAGYTQEINANRAAVAQEKAELDKLNSSLKITEMSYNQLKSRASFLTSALNSTSKSLDPETWNKYRTELTSVETQMAKVSANGLKAESTFQKVKISLVDMVKASAVFSVFSSVESAYGKIKELVNESLELAMKAEGIQRAFDKINNPHMLDKLRESTEGTVDDINLMQQAVKADHFKIPLDQLGQMLKFAKDRSDDTGESFEELEGKIISAFGKNSVKGFVQLGISSTELKNKMKETGDAGKAAFAIIQESLQKTASYQDTAQDKQERYEATMKNLQLKVGQMLLPAKQAWSEFLTSIASGFEKVFEKQKSASDQYKDQINVVSDLQVHISPLLDRYDELSKKTNLNKKEHEELSSIVKQVTEQIPGAASAFDKYGNAIAISTQRARDFINAQAESLKYLNSKAIKEADKDIDKATSKANQLKKNIDEISRTGTFKIIETVTGSSSFGRAQTYERNATQEEIAQMQKLYQKAVGDKMAAISAKNALDGTSLKEQIEMNNKKVLAEDNFNKMTESQLKSYISKFKDTKDKYVDVAQQIYSSKFGQSSVGDDSASKKALEALKKRLEAEQKSIQDERKALIEGDKEALADNNIYSERLGKLQSLSDKEVNIIREEVKHKILTEHEGQAEILKIWADKNKDIKSLSSERADILVASLQRELQMSQLIEDEKLAGKRLTAQQEHEITLQRIEADRKAEEEAIRIRMQLEPEKAKQLQQQLDLINQQAKTKTAQENGKYAETIKQRNETLANNDLANQLDFAQSSQTKLLSFNLLAQVKKGQRIRDLQVKQLKLQEQQELKQEGLTAAQKENIEQKYNQKVLEITELTQDQKMDIISNALGSVAGLFAQHTVAYKILATTQATIDTYVAANKAIAAYPPPFGAIAMAGVIASGLANVAKITGIGSGSKENDSSSSTGKRVVNNYSGRESGGFMDVTREQDGARFNATYDPFKRGYVDRPTVIVGEGPAGQSREWIASNAAISNPTIAPIISIIDSAQRAGNISTIDMNYLMRRQLAGFTGGGSITHTDTTVQVPGGYDPEIKALIAQNAILLQDLIDNGVNTVWSFQTYDKKRAQLTASRARGTLGKTS